MKLKELVSYFKNGGSFEQFCEAHSLDQESEVIEIYMEKPLSFDQNIAFFEIEKTEGNIEYTTDDIDYSNLFDFYYFLDAIEESNSKKLSTEQTTELLYDYAIYYA